MEIRSEHAKIESSIKDRIRPIHSPKNDELQYLDASRNINNGCYSEEDIKFVLKEGRMNLRTIYGVYLSMCSDEGIKK